MKEFLKAMIPYFVVFALMMVVANYEKWLNYSEIKQLQSEISINKRALINKFEAHTNWQADFKGTAAQDISRTVQQLIGSSQPLYFDGQMFEIKGTNIIEVSCQVTENLSMMIDFQIDSNGFRLIRNYADKNISTGTDLIDNLVYLIGSKIYLVGSLTQIKEVLESERDNYSLIMAEGRSLGFVIHYRKLKDYENISNNLIVSLGTY